MNQLNPDPQGGESNMIDDGTCYRCSKSKWHDGQCDESEVLAMRIRCLHCEYSTNAADSPEKQEEDIMQHVAQGHPEGATTQPTPAYETLLRDIALECFGYIRSQDAFYHEEYVPASDMAQTCISNLRPLLKTYGDSLKPSAQPVPSAGSKPQEVEGAIDEWEFACKNCHNALALHRSVGYWCSNYEQGEKFNDAADYPEDNEVEPESQPVADGGGLQFARDFLETMNRFGNWDDGCFYYNRTSASELQPLMRKAESLLSPEGSSRCRCALRRLRNIGYSQPHCERWQR